MKRTASNAYHRFTVAIDRARYDYFMKRYKKSKLCSINEYWIHILDSYFESESTTANLILAKLDAIDRNNKDSSNDVIAIAAMLTSFVELFLKHNPSIDDSLVDSTSSIIKARMESFYEAVFASIESRDFLLPDLSLRASMYYGDNITENHK